MFADDTAGLAKGENLTNLFSFVNEEIKKIARWFHANKMAVNVSKTKYIIFHARGRPINPDLKLYYDDNEPNENHANLICEIERIHNNHATPDNCSYKLLGIHLDENLTFDHYTKHLCSKLNKSLYCINRAKNFLSTKALTTLYYSLIHSHLSYCTPILSCASNSNIQSIFKIQKKAIRTVTRNTFLAHTNPLFSDNKILPLPKLITYSELKLMHSIIYGYCPPSLRHLFPRNDNRDISQNLRNTDDITIPFPRIKLFKKSLLYRLPTEWNALTDLKLQHNKITFEIGLKEHLFQSLSQELNPI
jgi:hypothetical protein